MLLGLLYIDTGRDGPKGTILTLLEPQSRFGDKPLTRYSLSALPPHVGLRC